MSKNAPVRTRCPYCKRFHFAHGKTKQIGLSTLVGMMTLAQELRRYSKKGLPLPKNINLGVETDETKKGI